MIKLKKLLISIFALTLLLCSAFLISCGESGNNSQTPAACEHEYGQWFNDIEPTCSMEGTDVRTCAKCGQKDYRVAQKLPHDTYYYSKEATCEEEGIKSVLSCRVCRTLLAQPEKIAPLGHNFENGVCTREGCGLQDPDFYDYEATPAEYFVFTLKDDGTYSVREKSASSMPDKIIVPNKYNYLPVTEIGQQGFAYSLAKKIVVHEGIKTIGVYAFRYAENLTEIRFYDGIESIHSTAFEGCKNLEYASMPREMPTDMSAFASLEKYKFNEYENGLYLGEESQYPYQTLIKVKDTSITDFKVHPETKIISDEAFKGCKNLVNLELPDGLEKMDASKAFDYGALKNFEKTSYENGLYFGNKNNPYIVFTGVEDKYAETLKLHENTRIMTNFSVLEMSELKTIEFNDKLTYIGTTIYLCPAIKNIVLPKSIKHINSEAFKECASLESITFAGENKRYEAKNNCLIDKVNQKLMRGCKNSVLPTDGIVEIAYFAFSKVKGLTQIKIPKSVKILGAGAFDACSDIEKIEYDGTVAEFNQIVKVNYALGDDVFEWYNGTKATEVICSDGSVALEK